ncbi:OmpL47-type beta-barrel domain-containing protein [Streptomyces phytohabitans]|uniref:OmpL47-type beta-barrel domain-containing protein n=1 Tax=Streptomyces phytohabitans TaxID=1150371 RepID=UPI00345C3292
MMTLVLATLTLTLGPSAQAQQPPGGEKQAAAQVLTWTAGDSITEYASAPTTAVAGEATLVFENSAATGNTTAMPHTLTFTTGDPDYNSDVQVNILANPNDANNGRHEVSVTLSPGTYHFYCALPGHSAMQGELVVTGDGGEDTTAPVPTADVNGRQDSSGAYLGSATVSLAATDDSSGVESVEYALDDGEFAAYTAPVVVDALGEHTVRYRATDKAGNVSEEKSVSFTVAEPPTGDTTPPEVTSKVDGEQTPDGEYVTMATVTLTATDDASGVASVEYAVNGGEFTAYTEPFMVHAVGEHTVDYRATDNSGNSSEVASVTFTVVEKPTEPDPVCPERDGRPLVVVGDEQAGVPNRVTPNGCLVNELIEDEGKWGSKQAFRHHVSAVTDRLVTDDVIDEEERAAIRDAAKRSDVGAKGSAPYEKVYDGTEKSFARWEHVGGGGFDRKSNGVLTSSREKEGMGMLMFPEKKFGDFSLRLQFRDDASGDTRANTGVFVRFPDVHDHPDESRPEWVAIKYGHEMQIYDGKGGDQYKTGSAYGFDLVGYGDSMAMPKGLWNDYEVRVEGQHYSVFRNGRLINEFDNAAGQLFSPPRDDDPGTDGRQHKTGYIGLQAHSASDTVSYRDVRIRPL